MGRTGKIGKPIAERYDDELEQIEVGQTTPAELQEIFGDDASLKTSGSYTEVWEVFRGGNMDLGQFLLWGQIAHDKDQSLLFTFRDGRLSSWTSEVHPDPEQ